MDKVRQLLSDVEEFYGLASRVQPVLERGPAYQVRRTAKSWPLVRERRGPALGVTRSAPTPPPILPAPARRVPQDNAAGGRGRGVL